MTPHTTLFGKDLLRNSERAAILGNLGCRVSVATSLDELQQIAELGSIQMLLVCQTVGNAECELLLAYLRLAKIKTEVALISSIITGIPSDSPNRDLNLIETEEEFAKSICILLRISVQDSPEPLP